VPGQRDCDDEKSYAAVKAYVAECIGTFALVFCGTGAIIINQETGGLITHAGIAASFGLVVMVMIYALGNTSGAHLNPAVTIAFAFSGKFERRFVFPYVISQIFGALIASMVLKLMFPHNEMLGSTIPAGTGAQSFLMECILGFLLMLVIFQVAHGSKEQGMFAGLAIGGVVLLEAMFAGPVSGASMNPARSLAPAVISGNINDLWIYLTAPILGSMASVPLHNYLQNKKV